MRVAGKEAAREAQNRGRGYCRVAGLARSSPGVALASLMSIFAQDLEASIGEPSLRAPLLGSPIVGTDYESWVWRLAVC